MYHLLCVFFSLHVCMVFESLWYGWLYNCWTGTFWDFCFQSPGLSATLSLRRLVWVYVLCLLWNTADMYFAFTNSCYSLRLFFFFLSLQEQKIREGLYMMGLKDEIFHLSWFITYALQAGFVLEIWLVNFCLPFFPWLWSNHKLELGSIFCCQQYWLQLEKADALLLSIYCGSWYSFSFLTRLCSAVCIVLWDYYSLYDGKSL